MCECSRIIMIRFDLLGLGVQHKKLRRFMYQLLLEG